jgi:hypothetical protein
MIDITKNKSFTEILKFLFKFLIRQKILIFTNYLFKFKIKKKAIGKNFFSQNALFYFIHMI